MPLSFHNLKAYFKIFERLDFDDKAALVAQLSDDEMIISVFEGDYDDMVKGEVYNIKGRDFMVQHAEKNLFRMKEV